VSSSRSAAVGPASHGTIATVQLRRVKAISINLGDKIVVTVARTMGVQGRKPPSGSPLMRLDYADGTVETMREDALLEVLR
jgi:hypothetical protein